MQSLSINMAAVQLASGNVAATMNGALKTSAMDGFGAIGRGASESAVHLSAMDEKIRALPGPIAKVVEGFALFQAVTTVWQAFNQALEDTEVRIARLNAIGAAAKQLGTGTTFLTTLIAQAKQLGVRVRAKPKPADQSKPLPSLSSARRAPRDAQDPDSVANVIRQLEKTRDIAEAELRTVGLSNVEKERAVDLAKAEAAARADVEKGVRASATLTAEETKRILEAADATATFKDRQKDLEQQLRANAETARYFGDMLSGAISDAVTDGKSLNEVLSSIGRLLSRGVLQALITGQGPLASLLGSAPAASAGPNAVGGLMGLLTGGTGGGGFLASLLGGGSSGGGDFPLALGGADDVFAAMLHTGGTVGRDGMNLRRLPAEFVAAAPRFHTGLGGDEFAAVLQRGERVLTSRQNDRAQAVTAGLAEMAASRPDPASAPQPVAITIDARGAQGNSEIQEAITRGMQAASQQAVATVGRNIGPMMKDHRIRFG